MAAGHKKYAAIFPNIRGLTARQPHSFLHRDCARSGQGHLRGVHQVRDEIGDFGGLDRF